jgi:hypothetical protein
MHSNSVLSYPPPHTHTHTHTPPRPLGRYLSAYDENWSLMNYEGSLLGRGVLTRKAEGSTSISVSIWYDHDGMRQPGDKFELMLNRYGCGQLSKSSKLQTALQDPHKCPPNMRGGSSTTVGGANTVGGNSCSPQEVEVRPSTPPGSPLPLAYACLPAVH